MDIRVDDLFFIYESDGGSVVALRGLHLNVAPGECLVIKGPNGSGKSTLVKLLTGFYVPTAGKISIGGRDISKIDPLQLRRELVSSIDQRGNLLVDLTIVQNIALAFSLVGQSYLSARKMAKELLDSHGFGHLGERYSNQLSAGERQFSSLLAAIATSPKVLIADEPSGELDNESAETMYTLLKSLAGNASVILVTHDERAEKYANRVVQIREGRISEEWLPNGEKKNVVDPFGWMRVRETLPQPPKRIAPKRDSNQESLVRGIDLELSYESRRIFSHVKIEGSSGQLIALSVASGSGKSSLLRILGGMQDPSKGVVYIKGQPLTNLSREDRAVLRNDMVGYMGQGHSALANISLSDHVRPMPPDLARSFSTRLPYSLSSFSGGERARIELLKVLATGKPILLLDEPTSQMDERRSLDAAQMILDYVDKGGLVITSTRDPFLLANAIQISLR